MLSKRIMAEINEMLISLKIVSFGVQHTYSSIFTWVKTTLKLVF